ncbi:MAG: hypothetical protein QOJ44_1788 [Acidimicrobiaceae bacterium]|nr:hypothetical protein [Acidimicrobiaceae bacterium]
MNDNSDPIDDEVSLYLDAVEEARRTGEPLPEASPAVQEFLDASEDKFVRLLAAKESNAYFSAAAEARLAGKPEPKPSPEVQKHIDAANAYLAAFEKAHWADDFPEPSPEARGFLDASYADAREWCAGRRG